MNKISRITLIAIEYIFKLPMMFMYLMFSLLYLFACAGQWVVELFKDYDDEGKRK